MSSIHFNRIIGNLGESLRDGSNNDDEEDGEEEDTQRTPSQSSAILETLRIDEEPCLQDSSRADVGQETTAGPSGFMVV